MALNRVPAGERDWAARIEARRRALSSGEAIAQPFQPGLPETVSRASWSVSVPFLMRLLRELAPQLPLELGTGLRVSTAIRDLPRINGAGRLITLDGSAEWVAVAEEGVSSLGLERVEFSRPLADTLPNVLKRSAPVDYAFVDAEHTEEATVGYFESIVPHTSPQAVMVFDDIPWSGELRRACRRTAHDERVCAAFALGRIGVAVIADRRA
jgi:predicted O-methyltransferase YrrM